MPPHPNTREAIGDSDDSDPDGEREELAAGGDGGGEGGVSASEQPAQVPPTQGPTAEGTQVPVSLVMPTRTAPGVPPTGAYEMSPGTAPEVTGDVGE